MSRKLHMKKVSQRPLKKLFFKSVFVKIFLALVILLKKNIFPANIYLFKVNNWSITKTCEICSKLTAKTPEQRHSRRVFLLLTLIYFTPFSIVSIVDFEQVNVSWVDVFSKDLTTTSRKLF